MSPAPEDLLAAYRPLVDDARDRFNLMNDVELVLSRNWGAEPAPGQMTIYCPPHDPQQEHVLLHYLAHGKMLEDGWQQPVFMYDRRRAFLLANRSADTFTDFWAYHLVADVFGAERLREYTDWIASTQPDAILQHLAEKRDHYHFSADVFSRYCTVFAVDWFGMAPVLLQPFHQERVERLHTQYDALHAAGFAEHAPPDLDARLEHVQEQFRTLRHQHITYTELLGSTQEEAFTAFYSAVWPDNPPATVDGFVSPISAD